MEELYQQIIERYKETGSVKKTAESLATYPIKVRRVLITEGLWHSKTSDQIMDLLSQGKSTAEIAAELTMSEKNVQSYMPYSRGQYGGADRSNEAVRSEEYRARKQTAAKNQVTKREAGAKKEDQLEDQRRLLEELKAEKEELLRERKELLDNIESDMYSIPLALQLHLKLKMGFFGHENKEILQKYGRMEKGITRDLIVPGDMTLHALHYAIMRAFGWQNSHLHSYVPYQNEFKKMTDGGLVKEWTRLIGMYFRFPGEDIEELYWDDDYDEDESIKSWLKSKYCGPYLYEGVAEHYLPSQMEVDSFRRDYPEIQEKTTDQSTWNIYFDNQCEELIERAMIYSILKTPADYGDWESWRKSKEKALKDIEEERAYLIKSYEKLKMKLDEKMGEAVECIDKVRLRNDKPVRSRSKSGNPDMDLSICLQELDRLDRELDSLCREHNPRIIPALSALSYRYDYGDGWEIKITCTNAWFDRSTFVRDQDGNLLYDKDGFMIQEPLYVDAFGKVLEGEFLDQLKEISRKEKPKCIAWDGINLVDDVGGVDGFCHFLEVINGDDPEEKREMKAWARSLGWTGRMPKPENLL